MRKVGFNIMLIKQDGWKLEFDDQWLKAKDIKVGKAYIVKDGRVMLYCGKNITDNYVFILLDNVFIINTGYYRVGNAYVNNYKIYAHETLGKYITQACKDVLNIGLDELLLVKLRGMPSLYCEYIYASMSEQDYFAWYRKRNILNRSFSSEIPQYTDGGVKKKRESIKQVPGTVYLTTNDGESYLYLGKDICGDYVYVYVGRCNLNMFNMNPLKFIGSRGVRLRNKKRVIGVEKDATVLNNFALNSLKSRLSLDR